MVERAARLRSSISGSGSSKSTSVYSYSRTYTHFYTPKTIRPSNLCTYISLYLYIIRIQDHSEFFASISSRTLILPLSSLSLSPPFLILSLRVSHNARFSVRARNRNFRSICSCVYMCVKKGARGRAKIVWRIRARRRIFRGRFTRTSIVVYSIASLVSPARLWKIIIKACTRDRTGG